MALGHNHLTTAPRSFLYIAFLSFLSSDVHTEDNSTMIKSIENFCRCHIRDIIIVYFSIKQVMLYNSMTILLTKSQRVVISGNDK
jgi:hypothetical protein